MMGADEKLPSNNARQQTTPRWSCGFWSGLQSCARRRLTKRVSSDASNSIAFLALQEVTLAVTRPNGDRLELSPFPPHATFKALKLAVKAELAIPCIQQQFVVGSAKIEASDTDSISRVLAGSHQVNLASGVVELGLVRVLPAAQEQDKLDKVLLMATAAGDHDKMQEALLEGACSSCCAAGSLAREACDRTQEEVGEDGNALKVPIGLDFTPMLLATATSDSRAIALLRAHGAQEIPSMEARSRHIGIAFRYRDFADVVRFLCKGADPNTRLPRGLGVQDTNHGTLLHACCALHSAPGAAPLMELLLRGGASLDAPDAEGDPPLAHARYFGAHELYELLEAHGARLTGPYYTRFPLGLNPLRVRA
mmetsp:Transcript_53826/g.99502  ORF Transcript_53826/g.99502 Transcript_53826/m.99502 type:complete len:366 (-) Transcript_53826:102-1199(-)